jgi:hypothetical protein
MKANCYECKYRGDVPGYAHSCCRHPSAQGDLDNPLGQIMAIFAGVGRVPPVEGISTVELHIKGNSHGIRNGWFCWPWNFDPVWLENCDGFEKS